MTVKRTDLKDSVFCPYCFKEPMKYSNIGIYRIFEDIGGDQVRIQAGDTLICECGILKFHLFNDAKPFDVERANVPNYEPVNLNFFYGG